MLCPNPLPCDFRLLLLLLSIMESSLLELKKELSVPPLVSILISLGPERRWVSLIGCLGVFYALLGNLPYFLMNWC